MRTLSITLSAAALLAGPAHAQNPERAFPAKPKPAVRCNLTADIVDYRGQPAAPRKLSEMPPATQIYTVYNVVDGCPQPVVVRKGIKGGPQRAMPLLRMPPRTTPAR